jgi:hypothetical protein
MSFKKWSAAQAGPNAASPADKSKVAPIVVKPVTTPEKLDKAPISIAPAPKS